MEHEALEVLLGRGRVAVLLPELVAELDKGLQRSFMYDDPTATITTSMRPSD